MRLLEIVHQDAQKLLRRVAIHFASVAPTKFKPRDVGGGIESGDWDIVDGKIVGKHIEIYVPSHNRDLHMVTVNAHGNADFMDSVVKKIHEWPNVLHTSDFSASAGADLGMEP